MARTKGSKTMVNGTMKAEVPARIEKDGTITDGGIKSVFSLETFSKEQKVYTYTVPVITSLEQAISLLSEDELKTAAQNALEAKAAKEARKTVSAGNNIPPVVVNGLVNTFRLMPQFANVAERKAQTQAIYDFLKGQPAMIESLKVMAAAAGDDDSEDTESSDS